MAIAPIEYTTDFLFNINAIEKINQLGSAVNTLVSEGGDTSGVAGGISPEINDVFYNAKTETGFQYVVVGDSTRNNLFNEAPYYYGVVCPQVNMAYVDQALSGIKMSEYIAGTRTVSVATTIAAISGTGSKCLIEFSMGINDSGLETQAGLVTLIKNSLNAIIASKPDVTIILCQPVRGAGQRQNLHDAYAQVAAETGYPILNVDDATIPVHGDPEYYTDDTHPNKYGTMRVINYIFNKILPTGIRDLLLLPEDVKTPPPSGNLALSVLNGSYSTGNGSFIANAAVRSTSIIDVDPNFILEIVHSGNSRNVLFYTAAGAYISYVNLPTLSGQAFRTVTIPVNAYKVAINISSDGATWDALGETPVVRYQTAGAVFLRQRDVNKDLNITLFVEQAGLIDKFGYTGEAGQITKSDGAGDFYWDNI